MARKYPRFLYSNPGNTKSEGPFIVHLLEPRFVAVYGTKEDNGSWNVYPLEKNTEIEIPVLDAMIKWYRYSVPDARNYPMGDVTQSIK